MLARLCTTYLSLHRDEKGATAIEYGLIAALVAVVIIAALTLLGDSLSGTFQSVADQMNGL